MIVTVNEKKFSGTVVNICENKLLLRLKPYRTHNYVLVEQGKFTFIKDKREG